MIFKKKEYFFVGVMNIIKGFELVCVWWYFLVRIGGMYYLVLGEYSVFLGFFEVV